MMIVALLSNIKSPILPWIMESLYQYGVSDIIGILDQKTETKKDMEICLNIYMKK